MAVRRAWSRGQGALVGHSCRTGPDARRAGPRRRAIRPLSPTGRRLDRGAAWPRAGNRGRGSGRIGPRAGDRGALGRDGRRRGARRALPAIDARAQRARPGRADRGGLHGRLPRALRGGPDRPGAGRHDESGRAPPGRIRSPADRPRTFVSGEARRRQWCSCPRDDRPGAASARGRGLARGTLRGAAARHGLADARRA